MNLIVEQGNTATKVAVYEHDELIETAVCRASATPGLDALFERYPLVNGIYSTVRERDEALANALSKRLKRFVFFDDRVRLPLEIAYRTPDTLGKDRIAAAAGAHYLHPGSDVLVIDAGTAITYEVVEASGRYVGGNISPGLTTRFRALHQFTEKLPLVDEAGPVSLIGTGTETAVRAGVVNGIAYEMDGYISALKEVYPGLFVFLTGGHSFYFEKRLKSAIFAAINLVLTGLNRILEYNVEN
ncbi:MAG: type III pantothenate kinase [Tannerella sp.]|nr:type III pantothenate kinase [Tannerella sp.]